jgi:site-specific recombinase
MRPQGDGTWKESALRPLLELVEPAGETRDGFGTALAALLSDIDATNLVGVAGIPGHRGFFSEFGDRLANHLLPSPHDERDLRELTRRLYRTERDARLLGEAPLDLFHRVAAAVVGAPPPDAWKSVRAAFADGFRLLLTRVGSEGLSPKVRARATSGPVSASPFHRVGAAGDALVGAWLERFDTADAAARFLKVSGECRKEVRVIRQHLDGAGVSVDIVFSLEVIERCLTRMALMTDIMESPPDARRSRAIHRLLSRLVLSAYEDRSMRHLCAWNTQLLGRKIVERSSETGEHYIARNLHEYRHIWVAAAGGGALTVGTGVVKTLIHAWHLPALPEGLLFGLNYSVSFVVLQHLGLILATKQPAMTAARLASMIRESAGGDREDRVAVAASQLTSSQLAAAVSNVVVVAVGAALFSWLFLTLVGRPFLDEAEAVDTLRVMSPLNSFTIWYAALTGVVLWLASVAGGWFDNWCVYHRIPDGIAQGQAATPWRRRLRQRIGAALSRHASAWGTNVSLGFMLGMAPEFGRVTGLPLDVRHVTLSTGMVSVAAASAGIESGRLAWLLLAIWGISVMFVLNLSVSFACSLFSAARAYELPAHEVFGILKAIGRRLRRSPLSFVRAPRPSTME